MNLEKYFDNVSPLSPPQSSHSSTDVATNSSITSPESETPFVASSLLNHAMGEEFNNFNLRIMFMGLLTTKV